MEEKVQKFRSGAFIFSFLCRLLFFCTLKSLSSNHSLWPFLFLPAFCSLDNSNIHVISNPVVDTLQSLSVPFQAVGSHSTLKSQVSVAVVYISSSFSVPPVLSLIKKEQNLICLWF